MADDKKVEDHGLTNAGQGQDKTPPKPLKETVTQKIERLEQEKKDLEFIINSQPRISASDSKYMTDMAFFDKQKVGTNRIEVKDITDHKNISLWTPWGKRIGPMHPNNARFCYHKFRRLGRMLYTQKPTEDQIQAYYKTPEYKAWKSKFDEDRAKKNESKSGAGLNKVIDAMVKITGQNRADIISIIDKPKALA